MKVMRQQHPARSPYSGGHHEGWVLYIHMLKDRHVEVELQRAEQLDGS